jgi:hypothetical protein
MAQVAAARMEVGDSVGYVALSAAMSSLVTIAMTIDSSHGVMRFGSTFTNFWVNTLAWPIWVFVFLTFTA